MNGIAYLRVCYLTMLALRQTIYNYKRMLGVLWPLETGLAADEGHRRSPQLPPIVETEYRVYRCRYCQSACLLREPWMVVGSAEEMITALQARNSVTPPSCGSMLHARCSPARVEGSGPRKREGRCHEPLCISACVGQDLDVLCCRCPGLRRPDSVPSWRKLEIRPRA